jgi:hypothetical protein
MELIECDYPFQNTEPTLWRLQPIWSDNYDVVLCRDIDSLPNTREAQATIAFVASPFLIQAMRTHFEHNCAGTRMLAGLCGFRSGIKAFLSGTFDDYYRTAHGGWGTDQDALMSYFLDRLGAEFLKNSFLDTCVHSFPGRMQEVMPGHDAGKLAQQVYDEVDLSHVPADVRQCLDALTTWPGQPVKVPPEAARLLLDQQTNTARAVRDCLRGDKAAKQFYPLPTDGTYRGICAAYTGALEHVTAAQGQQYLAEIRSEAPGLLDPSLVLPNDALGGPEVASYPDFATVSPTTLRYLKVLADLVTLFGPLAGLNVVEVGGGYGGQARLVRAFFPTVKYTIFDLPEPLALTRKYLERSGIVDDVTYIACSKSDDVPSLGGDLFLSNYALSELARDWFDAYVERVARGCTRGYITGNAQEATTFRSLEAVNPERIDERPLTGSDNFICVWGRASRDATTG